MRENCTHGSEGGDGESRSRPLSKEEKVDFESTLRKSLGFEPRVSQFRKDLVGDIMTIGSLLEQLNPRTADSSAFCHARAG